jgi:hypothetical protein
VIEQQPLARRVRHRLRPAAEVRLVAVHAEQSRAEVRQELVVEIAQQLVGARFRARQRPARIGLGEVLVLGEREDVLHVAERLQVGHQLDMARGGVCVEFAQHLRFERGRVGSDLRMTPEAEGVLHVEHQHVELEAHAEVDERVQRLGRRHLAARDVEHDPALRKVGSVVEEAGGQGAARIDQLNQRLDRVAQARSTRSDRQHVVALDAQPIGLAGVPFAPQLDAGPDAVTARVRLHGQAQSVAAQQRIAQGAGACEVPLAVSSSTIGTPSRRRKRPVCISKRRGRGRRGQRVRSCASERKLVRERSVAGWGASPMDFARLRLAARSRAPRRIALLRKAMRRTPTCVREVPVRAR